MRVEIPPLNTAGPMQVKAATILSSLVLCLKEQTNDKKFRKRTIFPIILKSLEVTVRSYLNFDFELLQADQIIF